MVVEGRRTNVTNALLKGDVAQVRFELRESGGPLGHYRTSQHQKGEQCMMVYSMSS